MLKKRSLYSLVGMVMVFLVCSALQAGPPGARNVIYLGQSTEVSLLGKSAATSSHADTKQQKTGMSTQQRRATTVQTTPLYLSDYRGKSRKPRNAAELQTFSPERRQEYDRRVAEDIDRNYGGMEAQISPQKEKSSLGRLRERIANFCQAHPMAATAIVVAGGIVAVGVCAAAAASFMASNTISDGNTTFAGDVTTLSTISGGDAAVGNMGNDTVSLQASEAPLFLFDKSNLEGILEGQGSASCDGNLTSQTATGGNGAQLRCMGGRPRVVQAYNDTVYMEGLDGCAIDFRRRSPCDGDICTLDTICGRTGRWAQKTMNFSGGLSSRRCRPVSLPHTQCQKLRRGEDRGECIIQVCNAASNNGGGQTQKFAFVAIVPPYNSRPNQQEMP